MTLVAETRSSADLCLDAIQRDGVVLAPWSMSPRELKEMVDHLDGCQVWPAHVAGKVDQGFHRPLREARADGRWPAFAPHMVDVVCAPHFLEYALRCFPIVKAYFGEFPRLYSVNCFWTQPAPTQYSETHDWHRDGDDRKQLGLFMFGTDVTEDDGPHLYQRGTHKKTDFELPDLRSPPQDRIAKIVGPPGTMFFEDPIGVHMGQRPNKPRMFAWARWGVSNPPVSYSEWDKLKPVPRDLVGDRYPGDPELQEAIRLVVS